MDNHCEFADLLVLLRFGLGLGYFLLPDGPEEQLISAIRDACKPITPYYPQLTLALLEDWIERRLVNRHHRWTPLHSARIPRVARPLHLYQLGSHRSIRHHPRQQRRV